MTEIVKLVDRIRPLLAGISPEIQGAALADCLAIWLAGHDIPGDRIATWEWRDDLMENHWVTVRDLISINAKIMGTTP